MKIKTIFFYEKLSILIPDLYFYSIKIRTNIKKILVEKYAGKSQFFQKNFFVFFNWVDAARPCEQWSSSLLFICNVNSGDGEQKKRRAGKQTCAATHGGRTQLLVAVVAAVAAFPISGSSSFLLCLSAFLLLLLLFCRFSISSSIPVDDGVVVAADGGMAVRVADRPCSALYFFFFFRLCFFSSFFFGLFQLPFFCALSSLVFIGKNQG
jgi:hypothetical protein